MKERLIEAIRAILMMVIAVPLSVAAFIVVAWCLTMRPDESCEYTRLNEYDDLDSD